MAVQLKKGDALGLLNLTPIIDIVFNLLIFFLVTARFEEEEKTLDNMTLPQASSAAPMIAKPTELFVNIDDRGRYFVSGEFISANKLEETLRQAAANNPGRQMVVMRADRRCPWQHVMTVVDLCKKHGIRDCVPSAAASAPPAQSSENQE